MRLLKFVAATSLLILSGILPMVAQAELVATPLQGDTRLVQFQFDEDNTYLVLTKPKAVTHLQFGADENIMSVAAGDTKQWELTPTKNRKNIFVKPVYENLETSLTVITDKRTYQFVLRSTGDGKKWYQRVSWLYSSQSLLEIDAQIDAQPESVPNAKTTPKVSEAESTGGLKPKDIKFGYEVTGDAPFKPIVVFDDGKFTYLQMPSDLQELPALFAVVEESEYALVNYVVQGEYIVAQRLLAEAVLKLGKKEVRIIKKKPRTFLGFKVGEPD